MRKNYDSMDAYKVVFNANEQVSAACLAYDNGSKYHCPANGLTMCELDSTGTKYTIPGYASSCKFTDDGCPDMGVETKYQQ